MVRGTKQKGFTLMELLVVIAILGILIVAGFGSFTSSQRKTRDTKRKNDLRQISLALETYYNDKGSYPVSTNGKITGCITGSGTVDCEWGDKWSDASVTPETMYMLLLPSDVPTGATYYYDSDGTYFRLYARLENTQDQSDGINLDGYDGTNCGGGALCTYGIASTNASL